MTIVVKPHKSFKDPALRYIARDGAKWVVAIRGKRQPPHNSRHLTLEEAQTTRDKVISEIKEQVDA